MPYSMNSLPSVSHTRQPRPRARKDGDRSGYWSSPLAYVCDPPGMISCARCARAAPAAERPGNPLELSDAGTPSRETSFFAGAGLLDMRLLGPVFVDKLSVYHDVVIV